MSQPIQPSGSDVIAGVPAATRLFVYGTLLDRTVLESVLGRRYRGEQLRAQLPGYARRSVPDWEYALLFPDASSVTDGQLLLDLTLADFVVLDAYEDVDSGAYERRPVDVEVWDCGPTPVRLSAQTYLAGPRFR
jgi:hypothetical protein